MLLHRVGRDSQGPLDSTVTDSRGRFRIRFRADSSALYLLSARHGGVEYFSTPVHTNPARPDTAIRLLVYDTSSTAPVTIAARHIVVPRPGEDGSRSVLDLLVLRNAGSVARVAGDSSRPSWSGALPTGSAGFQLGESDLSPDAVTRQGDSVLVFAPIAPGEKQLTLTYVIPRGRESVDLPIGSDSPLNVLLEEGAAKVSGGALTLADSQQIEGRWFHRWSGRVAGGQSVHLSLPRLGRTPRLLLAGLVGGLALVLGLAAWRVVARRVTLVDSPPPDQLLDTLAELDAKYAGREVEVSVKEWQQYQQERTRLKGALESALAAAEGPR